ncbi:MAG: PD-(D/E)XK nuclease family protein [Muribaculaceae bacterium]|nr:PD-(D/E)XK nuclease family protein [Muribaculaceae bacterium]
MAVPFLQSIAKAYASREKDLSSHLFVFPSRRACTFFLRNLTSELKDRVTILPEVTTMSDFVEKASGRVVAGRIELLFILYQAYTELQRKSGAKTIQDFDRFRRWGETALSDFNEVDMQDVDPDEIFKNVKDLKEISSNFLTEEQRKVMEEFFGQVYDPAISAEDFWIDFNEKKDNRLHRKFLPIWQTLAPLYHAFHEALEKRGLITSGGAYRLAAGRLEEGIPSRIGAGKIVIVGFNALTRSEQRILDALSSYETDDGGEPFAEFFWDTPGPVIGDRSSAAGRYVLHNKEKWPSPQWAAGFLGESETPDLPESMKVIAVPSCSLQSKVVGDVVDDISRRIPASDFEDAKVAVVLPDENLLIPLLYSLPENVKDVNLTMGYPLKLSGAATFVSLLRRLQGSRRKSGDSVGYYYKDFEAVLSHPFSHAIFGNGVSKVKDWIRKHHNSVVDVGALRDISPALPSLLRPLSDDASPDEAVAWLDAILSRSAESISDASMKMVKASVDVANIEFYRLVLKQTLEIVKEYGISMQWRTFLTMTDRLLTSESVTFEGQPLKGLQVMGMLETRALDFERIIIPSLNERILPARRRVRTFISDSLRRAYGLPPVNYSESIFAYYFFRMIARAKEVVLLYDSRSSEGARSGDVSRYVLQLQYLYAKDRLKLESRSFDISKSDLHPSPVEKSEEILDLLSAYRNPGPEGRNLSATALTRYAGCQIRFYFEHLLRIHTDEESVEFIDAITQGNVLHYAMQNIYLPEDRQGIYLEHPVVIDAALIAARKKDTDNIRRLIRRGINKEHFHRPDDRLDTPLRGSVEYVAKVLLSQVLRILDFDLSQAPFLLYGVEIAGNVSIRMPEGAPINMRFAIDRLDSLPQGPDYSGTGRLRVVDYKTGAVHVQADSMEDVFKGDPKGRNLLQLWLYANLFDALPDRNLRKDSARPILDLFGKDSGLPRQPLTLELYDVNYLHTGKHTYPKIGDFVQTVHTEQNAEFLSGLKESLIGLFDPDTPFRPTEDPTSCTYCPFKTICWR